LHLALMLQPTARSTFKLFVMNGTTMHAEVSQLTWGMRLCFSNGFLSEMSFPCMRQLARDSCCCGARFGGSPPEVASFSVRTQRCTQAQNGGPSRAFQKKVAISHHGDVQYLHGGAGGILVKPAPSSSSSHQWQPSLMHPSHTVELLRLIVSCCLVCPSFWPGASSSFWHVH